MISLSRSHHAAGFFRLCRRDQVPARWAIVHTPEEFDLRFEWTDPCVTHHGGLRNDPAPARLCRRGTQEFRPMPITIRQAFETHYVPNAQLAVRTLERYRLEILRWERQTPNPTIDQITTETFNRFRKACLTAGLKACTIEAGIRTILQILRLCGPESDRRQGLGLIPRVPYVGKTLREQTRQRPMPTVDQLRIACRLTDQAIWPPQASPDVWWRCWIGFAYVTGLRLTDMLTIERSALQGDVVHWTAHKTGHEHVFVLPDWLLEWMQDLPNDSELLFPCRRLPCFVRRELKRLSLAAEIQNLTPHGLRRCSITEWSIVDSDCGKLIHGEGLGIRNKYVHVERKLRANIARLPSLKEAG